MERGNPGEYSIRVESDFASFEEVLIKIQNIIGVPEEVTEDTQVCFMGVLPGSWQLCCVHVACRPMSDGEIRQKPWIPMVVGIMNSQIIGGVFIVDLKEMKGLVQGVLDSEKETKARDCYAKIRASDTDWSILHHQLAAKRVRAGHARLTALMNPADLETAAQAACRSLKKHSELLQRFKRVSFIYYRLWPDKRKCPVAAREIAAKEMERPLWTDLKVKIAIPLALLEYDRPTILKPLIRFPGGGGTTGHGQGPWLYPADFELAELLVTAIVCDVELPLLPESDGTVIKACIQRAMSWLVKNLEIELNKHLSKWPMVKNLQVKVAYGIFGDRKEVSGEGPEEVDGEVDSEEVVAAESNAIDTKWSINWDSVALFGVSFGGGMAVLAWLSATGFTVRELVLRAPLLRENHRDPSKYAGVPISFERASNAGGQTLEEISEMPYVLPRSGSPLPLGLWVGPMLGIGRKFEEAWKAPTVEKEMEQVGCPDKTTRVFIRHGSEDKHVPCQDIIEIVEWIRANWKSFVDFKIQAGKTHVWDADEPLDDEQRVFHGLSER